jgi:hypothetical protein
MGKKIKSNMKKRRELKRYYNKQSRKSNHKILKFYDNMSNITQNIQYNKEEDFHIYNNKKYNRYTDYYLQKYKTRGIQKYNGCKMKHNQERDNKYDL